MPMNFNGTLNTKLSRKKEIIREGTGNTRGYNFYMGMQNTRFDGGEF